MKLYQILWHVSRKNQNSIFTFLNERKEFMSFIAPNNGSDEDNLTSIHNYQCWHNTKNKNTNIRMEVLSVTDIDLSVDSIDRFKIHNVNKLSYSALEYELG